ncbi:hypothetical protein ACT8ZV_10010 [Nocardioides sp. MAHUQ-72]|uniref:hypothetical protein n=1 Tax=unclassified Nocardioides TaxID=2615069 RepID=UPI00361B3B5B
MCAHQPVGQWPATQPGPRGFGCSLFGNLAIALVFYGAGVLAYGYGGEDGLTGHPALLLTAIGVALAGSFIAALVFLTQPRARQFGTGLLVGALVAALVEFVALATYLVQVVGS